MLRTLGAILIAASCLLSPRLSAHASAQDEVPPTEATETQARELYTRGAEAFQQGEFRVALGLFEQVYALSRLPVLLFNLASCHDRLEEREAALRHYRAYLAAVPDAENADYVQSRIIILDGEDTASEARETDPPEAHDPPVEERHAPVETSHPDTEPSRVGPAVLMVAGGAAALGAVVSGVLTLSSRSDLRAMCDGLVCPNDAQDTHDAMQRRALTTDVMAGVALGLLSTGLIWRLVQPSGHERDDVQVACGFGGCTARVVW